MSQFNDAQKVKELIRAAKQDRDPVSFFGFGADSGALEGGLFVVKDGRLADQIFKWLESQRLVSRNPMKAPRSGRSQSRPPSLDGASRKARGQG